MGLDICCQAVFKDEHLKTIESINTQISQFLAKNIQNWLKLWKFNHSGGFYPFDTFVPIYLLNQELFKSIDVFLNVETINIPGKKSITKKKRINSAPITYCTNFVDKNGGEKLIEILISNLIK